MTMRYLEQPGTFLADTLNGQAMTVSFGLQGNDTLRSSSGQNAEDQFLIGGSGNDTYRVDTSLTTVLPLRSATRRRPSTCRKEVPVVSFISSAGRAGRAVRRPAG